MLNEAKASFRPSILQVKSRHMIKKGDLYFPAKDFKKKAWISDRRIYQQAFKNPIKFWEKLAKELFWSQKWKKVFEHRPPYFKWFLGGKLNITENCLDRNLPKKGNKVALIWEPEPIKETPKILTYQDLFKEVNRFANALLKLGVKKGDRVGIYLPMIPEVIISMLACARIGAVHTVVFSAFSPAALKIRLQDTGAKIL
ncbi:MAG: acetyl-coenzyme A synthetase, partial [Candidatus Nealsonbacteria bacterium]